MIHHRITVFKKNKDVRYNVDVVFTDEDEEFAKSLLARIIANVAPKLQYE